MVGVYILGYRKAGGGERKRLGSREAGFDAGKGRGSTGEHRSGGVDGSEGDVGDDGNEP